MAAKTISFTPSAKPKAITVRDDGVAVARFELGGDAPLLKSADADLKIESVESSGKRKLAQLEDHGFTKEDREALEALHAKLYDAILQAEELR